ncbi:MAG: methionine adenosyltransferase [Candidatus Saelkia tenebricola]|nr:methionine adenosyltransferase [Candidatus Saelkia tenebricola]
MKTDKHLVSSESVTKGHPDKMADAISDAILDNIIEKDSDARVACETFLTTGLAMIAGEVSTNTWIDVPRIVRKTIKEIGYVDSAFGFCYKDIAVSNMVVEQARDIALGIDIGGAGDQGMMYGYATDETPEFMPLPIMLAHKLTLKLTEVREVQNKGWLGPDGKSQVTLEYKNGLPKRVECIVVSNQHIDKVGTETLREYILKEVIIPAIPKELIDKDTIIKINPTGRFVIGGPNGDTGLTGRKIMVDTYGGIGRHGGGAFSGKDPTKVDRSGAYMARYIAKNIVAARLAKKCEIQLSYAIGIPEPVSVMVDTFGTGLVPDLKILKCIVDLFLLEPRDIINFLDLKKPIYKETSCYGHFGREQFTWEKTGHVYDIRKYFKLRI